MTGPDAATVAQRLGLEPLETEGGFFRRTYTADGLTSIYYLVAGDDFSAMHRLRAADELYFFHAGSPLRMLILDGAHGQQKVLGPDPLAAQLPHLVVPAGTWQGATSDGEWSLVSTVVVPGFVWSDFELGDQPELTAAFPHWATRLDQLCR